MDTGVQSPNLPRATTSESLLVNSGGGTARQLVGDLAAQLVASEPMRVATYTATLFETVADLPATTAQVTPWVYADPDTENRGIYAVSGDIWVWALPLPYSVIKAEVAGGGTANVLRLTTNLPVLDGMAVTIPILVTNTGAVTVVINDAAALPLRTNSGLEVEDGGLPAGGRLMAVREGGELRLTSDVAVANLILAAKVDAQQARTQAVEAAGSATGSATTATTAAGAAAAAAGTATTAAASAISAAEASGSRVPYDTYALASAALADADLTENQVVEVFNDETRGGARTLYRVESAALVYKTIAGLDVDDDFTPSFTGAVPVRIKSAIELRDGQPIEFFKSPIGADYKAAFDTAFEVSDRVILGPGTAYGVAGRVLVPEGKHLVGNMATLRQMATGGNAETLMVMLNGDHAQAYDLILDGNVSNRFAAGDLASGAGTSGVRISNASHCRVSRIWGKNLGYSPGTDDGDVILLGDRSFVSIYHTVDATKHTEGNIVRDLFLDDPAYRVSFFARMWTEFTESVYDADGLHCQFNLIENGVGVGTGKNFVELVGPNTIFNTVRGVTALDFAGTDCFEADFGASYNTFERCLLRGVTINPAANAGAVNGFSAGGYDKRNDPLPDFVVKRPRYNKFIDCGVVDTVLDANNLRCCIDDGGIGNQWIRPFMRNCSVTASGETQGWLAASMMRVDGEELCEYPVVIDPDFDGVNIGLRFGNTRTLGMRVRGGRINATSYALYAPSAILEDCVFEGGEYYSENDEAIYLLLGKNTHIRNNWLHNNSSDAVVRMLTNTASTTGSLTDNVIESYVGTTVSVVADGGVPCVISRNIFKGRGANAAVGFINGRRQTDGNFAFDLSDARQAANARSVVFADAIPTSGIWIKGDLCINNAPDPGEYEHWICTTSGAAVASAWTSGSTYTAAATLWRSNGGVAYECIAAGAGTATAAPVHTSGDVTGADGYTWRYKATGIGVWKGAGLIQS